MPRSGRRLGRSPSRSSRTDDARSPARARGLVRNQRQEVPYEGCVSAYGCRTARMRTALLAGVSQNLRPPLAAAQSAVGYLRRVPGTGLTADDYDELLATVEQSLGQIARLAATMRDASQS